jgi:hypothetical protein
MVLDAWSGLRRPASGPTAIRRYIAWRNHNAHDRRFRQTSTGNDCPIRD